MIEIGRVDADFGALPAKDVGERRAVEDLAIERIGDLLDYDLAALLRPASAADKEQETT